ncbi:MAG TPA: FadR/GntR family transcriptional regulator [Rectinemataceae bacterium]|nr:FadR/GntR family transcriptional regulator [Rectinemataceae bacterium]
MATEVSTEQRVEASPPPAKGRKAAAIERFEGLILSGRFTTGERLPPERELAADLGVSRPVVHAALVELEARGLVRVEARRGVFVADWRRSGSAELLLSMLSYSGGDLSENLFDGLLEMRLLFETETARLAASRRGREDLDELERVLARERLAGPAEGREGFPSGAEMTELDYDFHLAVALASGNDVYPLLLNSFGRVYRTILGRFYADPEVIPQVFAYHRELVAAIAAGDEEGSVATMRDILQFGERNLRLILVRERKRP